MEKSESGKFLKKISGCYPNQFFITDEVKEEWCKRLEPYDLEDVEEKFEEHLKSEMHGDKPPLIHNLTRNLITHENKKKVANDYYVRCNLCGEEMLLSVYDRIHFEKCLLIKSLILVLKENGKTATYEELDNYDTKTLTRIWDKYVPLEKEFNFKY